MKEEKEGRPSCAARDEVLNRLHTELQIIDARRDEVLTAIRVVQGMAETPGTSSVANIADAFADLEIDLADARNLGERLVCIAIAAGEPIDAWEAARYLVTQGYSKSAVRNLRPHVYNTLNDHPDFAKVGRGVFEYIPQREKVTPATGNLLEGMVH